MGDKDETEELHKKETSFCNKLSRLPNFPFENSPVEKISKDLITGLDSSRHDRSVKPEKETGHQKSHSIHRPSVHPGPTSVTKDSQLHGYTWKRIE